MTTITLNLDPIIHLDDDQFYQLCQANRDVRFERNAKGELIVMSPTGGETGNRNIELAFQLQAWSRQNNLGIAFDSSTGFKLPNGADRSPIFFLDRTGQPSLEGLSMHNGSDWFKGCPVLSGDLEPPMPLG